MKVYVFEEDSSVLELLVLYLKSQGHEVQGFLNGYKCPLYLLEECECPADRPCAEAVLLSCRVPDADSVNVLVDQARKGCKLPKANKAVMSASYSPALEGHVRSNGFFVIKKPFRLKAITAWLEECDLRLKCVGP